ncbi:MAG: TonB-dependent receptor [Melioribacteraceae bacterium]|nr:TonB-dependent receptor [Melioribacteraceae bacterium]
MKMKKDSNYLRSKLEIPTFLLVLLFLITSAQLIAQTGSGNLQGKITDISSGEPLLGANVFLEGTAIGAATDMDGFYRIRNVSSGKYNLVVSYMGYKKQIVSVDVTTNRTVTVDVKLEWVSNVLGKEVIVTGQLIGQAQAINQQLTSDQIVNIVSEQKIKELPDANAAEAVGRLPGVAVQRDGGEASKLMIRGLDPKFANISVNGIQIPATGADRRDVDLSLISQSTLSGIELYKALTPDQDADAIAGVVNLVTGKARSEQKITVDVFGIYSGLSKSAKQYKLSGQYSNRFFNDLFGVQAGINAERRIRNREMFSNTWDVPANQDYKISRLLVQYDDEVRKRYGGNLNLDFNTPDGGNIKFINLYNQTSRNLFISDRDYTVGTTVQYTGRAIDREIYSYSNSLIGENHLGSLKINWALSHAYTKNEVPFDHTMRFYENTSVSSGMRNITDPKLLKFPGEVLIPFAWNNFAKATLDRGFFHTESNDERNYDIKLDLEHPFTLTNDLTGTVKAGFKYRDKTRHRTANDQESIYYLRGIYDHNLDDEGNVVGKDWASSSWPNRPKMLLTDYLIGPPYSTRELNGKYLLNPIIDGNMVREWYEFNRYGTNAEGKTHEYYNQLASIRDIYKVNEKVTGTYAMIKLNAWRLITFIAGMRYEVENNEYSAKFAPRILGVFESQSAQVKDTVSNYKKEYWFPNAHLKISPVEWIDLRVAVSKSISRPDYLMRLPSLYINNQAQEITSGNPNLEPAISWNYDANITFYASQYGLLTISGFRKNIDNIFYWLNNIKLMNAAQIESTGLPVKQYGPFNQYELDMPMNTKGTKVWGYEIDLQTHLSFLPGALQNIVISANFSRMWSQTVYPRFTLIQPPGFPPKAPIPTYYSTTRELNGQTDYTGNVSVGYDYLGFSGRVSGYFQGPFLMYISNIETQDQYQKAFSRWDLALKQVFTDNITMFINVNNFTNVLEGSYLNFRNLDNGGYLFGISAELGVQYTF